MSQFEDRHTIEDKYTSVKQLIELGKEKGYLLYDEIYEMLPDEVVAPPRRARRDLPPLRRARDRRHRPPRALPEPRRRRGRSDRVRQEGGRDRRVRASPSTRRPTTRCACTCARWARCRCSTARARSRSRSASSRASGLIYEALCENPVVLRELLRLNELAQKDKTVLRELIAGNDPDEPLDPKAADRIKPQPQDLRADRQARPRDPEAAQAAEALQGRAARSTRSSSARSTALVGKIAKDIRTIDFSRPDPQPPGRLPQGHRPRSSRASSRTSSARQTRAQEGDATRSCKTLHRRRIEKYRGKLARARGALRHHARRGRGDDQEDPRRARRCASAPRRS